jgi:hypothetical protein
LPDEELKEVQADRDMIAEMFAQARKNSKKPPRPMLMSKAEKSADRYELKHRTPRDESSEQADSER